MVYEIITFSKTRLFLTIIGNKGYVVHGIYKKSQKTPKKDLELSIKRIKELTR